MYQFHDLTDTFPMKFDVSRMVEELEILQRDTWLEHYDPTLSRGWKSVPLVSRNGELSGPESQRVAPYNEMKRTSIAKELPYFNQVLDSFKCAHGRIRITRLDPGAGIDMHRDISDEVANLTFSKVRLHIPILTNPGVWFWVDGTKITMAPGRLYYVNFSKKHYVRNEGDSPRYHLVLDLDVNDWLWQFFPKPSFADKTVMFCERNLLPISWKLINFRVRMMMLFWKLYNDSALQKLRYRLFPKNPSK